MTLFLARRTNTCMHIVKRWLDPAPCCERGLDSGAEAALMRSMPEPIFTCVKERFFDYVVTYMHSRGIMRNHSV